MLCLKRNVGETIILADGLITIMVTAVSGEAATIGIEASRDINIVRGELCDTSLVGSEVITQQVRGETAEEREHRLAMAELQTKKPGQLRHAK